jgi:hypothetical protein
MRGVPRASPPQPRRAFPGAFGAAMTPAPSPPALVVRGPDSLPALVPHLVGFHPAASLVLVGLAPQRRTVRVTVRIDLPEEGDDLVDVLDAWAPSLAALPAAGALETILVLYPRPDEAPWGAGPARDLPHRALVDELAADLGEAGIHALDAVCVVGERMRSYWCDDSTCCPPEGRVADVRESLRVRATLVAHGSAPLASRDLLVGALAPRSPDDPLRLAVDRARDGVVIRMPSGALRRVEHFVAGARDLADDPRTTARLVRLVVMAGWLCSAIRSRDLLLRTLTVDPDPAGLAAARTVLAEAVRCADGPDAAPVASVLAVCCWVAGDGAAARVALERAMSADPAYPLAGLVSAALDTGTPPWTWVAMMGEVSVEEILGEDAGVVDDPEEPVVRGA